MNKKHLKLTLDLVLMILLVLLDQVTKYLAILHLRGGAPKVLIPGVLELVYVENLGAAFGILKNAGWLFIIIALVILAAILFVLLRLPEEKKFVWLHLLLTVLASGALGNLIDRLNSTHVVDFIYVSLIHFPVFNVADIYVTCSAAVLFVVMFTVFREEEFDFLKRKPVPENDA